MANGTRHLWGLLDGANDLIQITDPDGDIMYVNPAWCRTLGYNSVDVTHRSMLELLPLDERDRYRDILQVIQSGTNDWDGELTLFTHTGQAVQLQGRMSCHPINDQPAEIWSLWHPVPAVPSLQPIGSDHGWAETLPPVQHLSGQRICPDSTTLLTQQNHILQLIARDYPLTDILTELAYLIEQQAAGMLCSFLLLENGGVTLRHGAAPSLPDSYNRAIDGITIGAVAGSCGTAAYRQEQVIVTSIATDPLWANFRQLALAHDLQSCWSTPIFSGEGKVLGTFAMYYRQPRSPSVAEFHLIQLSTDLASIAIERHCAKAALHQSEERLRLALDFTGVGSWDWDIANDRLILSESTLRLLGIAPGTVISYPAWLRLIHPEDILSVEQAISHALETHTDYIAEYRVIHPDDSLHWLLSKGRGIYDTATQVVRMVGVVLDITDRKRVEELLHLTNQALDIRVETQTIRLEEALADLQTEVIKRKHIQTALQQSEMRYRAIVEGQTELVCRYLPDGTLTFVNDAYCQVVGHSRVDLLDNQHKLFLLAADPAIANRLIAPPLPENPFHWLEHQITLPNGDVRWQQWNSRAIYSDAGELVEFQAVGRDITAHKMAEESLRRSAERLRQAQQVAHIGNWEFDIPHQTITWSEELFRLFGLNPTQPEPTYAEMLQHIHPDDRVRLDTYTHQLVTHGTPIETEYRIVLPDGNLRYIDGRAEAVCNDRGEVVKIVGTALDISDRKRVETAQKQAEAALRLTDQNLRLHIENSPLATIQWDCAFRIQSWSRQAEEIFGWTAAEVMGKHFNELRLVFAADCDQVNTISAELLKGGRNTSCNRNYTKTGAVIYCEWYNSALTDANGDLISILSLVQDVTCREQIEAERTQAEAKLRQSEARLREAQRVAHIGNWEFDPGTETIVWSAETCRILGLAPDHSEPSLQQAVNCFHGSDRESLVQTVAQAVKTGANLHLDARIVRPDGTLRHVEIRGEASTNQQKQTVRLFGTLMDTTDRKVAEACLRESEERFRQLAENIDEVFFIHAADLSEVIYISPAYETVWQRDRASLYQHPQSWLKTIHPDELDVVLAGLNQMLAGQPAQAEYRIVLPDGTTRWINARSFPIYDEAGQLQRHVGLAEDVTATKRAAAEIHKALSREKEINELKSRFVSMISHEFRTPLTTIQSAADLLQYYEWSKAEQQERFQQIFTAVQHMTQLLEEVLLIGKADAGKLEFNPTLLNLTKFCEQLVAEFQLTTGNTAQITFRVHGDRHLVWVDQKLIRQIVTNLLSNAIKYSHDGGTIEFKLDYQAERVLLQIQDHGIGIPPEEQTHLFEAFYRATNVNEVQGTGLGLAIVKKCVDLYGGIITLNSEVGVGSTFNVSLPLIFY